jgi:hypothetical protein
MKAFKINSQAALAVISTVLSLSIAPVAKTKKRGKLIKELQLKMFINFQKYGVHVLEEDTFLYEGLTHIKSLETENDVQFIERLEVIVDKENPEGLSKNLFAFVKHALKAKGGLVQGETAQQTLSRVLSENRVNMQNDVKPEVSKDPCDCQACTSIREMKKENKLQKKK